MTCLKSGLVILAVASALTGPAALAQVVVDAPSSPSAPADIWGHADDAVAQVNDTADAKATMAKADLYKQLMEVNGTSRNIRVIMSNTKAAVRMVILDRTKAETLSLAQEAKYDEIASRILKETELNLINAIALNQSKAFSDEEIRILIKANASAAGIRYNAGKFIAPEANASQIQAYMVDAVVKIITTFKESVTS